MNKLELELLSAETT